MRVRRRLTGQCSLVLLLSCLGLGVPVALAGADRWTRMGPGGGRTVLSLAIDPQTPSTLYAAPYGAGVFKSIDGGATWALARNGLTATSVGTIVIDRQTPTTVYAATSSGVFKSVNAAESWSLASQGLGGSAVTHLAINAQTPATLYAASGAAIYRSVDGAASWSQVNQGLGNNSVSAFAVDPTDSRTLYAATALGLRTDGGLYKSTDAGTSWSLLGQGLENIETRSLVIDPASPSVLYAGVIVIRGPALPGVFKSTDGGATWGMANFGLPTSPFVSALVIDPSAPWTLYAALGAVIYRSVDGAASWSKPILSQGSPFPFYPRFLVTDSTSSSLYAGTSDGLFRTIDRGANWTKLQRGMEGHAIDSLALEVGSPPVLYAGSCIPTPSACNIALLKTSDQGMNWTSVALPGSGDLGLGLSQRLISIAVVPLAPGTIFAGTPAGTFKSTDGARTFSPTPLTRSIRGLAPDPTAAQVLYAAADDGVYKTVDGGVSWLRVLENANVYSVAVAKSEPATLYAGGVGEVLRSRDGGGTWSRTGPLRYGTKVSVLEVDPISSSTVYAGGQDPSFGLDGSLHRTRDRGDHWEYSFNGVPRSIVINPVLPTNVYLGTTNGILRSFDGGLSWSSVNDGLPGGAVLSLALDPSRPTVLYAGTGQSGVFQLASDRLVGCSASSTNLCLNANRFSVRVEWVKPTRQGGSGQAVSLTSDSGYFWFFTDNNVELVTKVVDGRAVNNKFWFFSGALSNVQYRITVTDTETGVTKTYFNPQGQLASIADTSAF